MTATAWRFLGTTLFCGALAACGGGTEQPPYRPMMVNLTTTTAAQTKEITRGSPLGIDIDGTLARIDIGPAPVFLNVRDASGIFADSTVMAPTGNVYKVTVSIAPNVAPASYNGTLVVRACLDSACLTPYAGTTASVAYSLKVN
jgi:hypothetical protein